MKNKRIKYKDRFKYHACPVCGSTQFNYHFHCVEYPEVWNTQICSNCGCYVGFEDNSPWYDIWDYIKETGVRSKKKVLKEVQSFYDNTNKSIKKII